MSNMIVRKQGSLLLTLDSCENRALQTFHAFPQFFRDFSPRQLFFFCAIFIRLPSVVPYINYEQIKKTRSRS